MTTVLTNTNTAALLEIADGNLQVLEEFAQDWKKSLAKENEPSSDQGLVQNCAAG
jgi:hypothetical protein